MLPHVPCHDATPPDSPPALLSAAGPLPLLIGLIIPLALDGQATQPYQITGAYTATPIRPHPALPSATSWLAVVPLAGGPSTPPTWLIPLTDHIWDLLAPVLWPDPRPRPHGGRA
jgi:hypothetical protein